MHRMKSAFQAGDWAEALSSAEFVRDYFISMGMADCFFNFWDDTVKALRKKVDDNPNQ